MPTVTVHRDTWREISRVRVREAQTLLDAQEWSGAYYLAGYAVECGLKACLMKQFKASTMPDKRFVNEAYSHDIESLVKLAGLKISLDKQIKMDATFSVYWATVKDWSEITRYQITAQNDAEDLVRAVSDRRRGIMKWVKSEW